MSVIRISLFVVLFALSRASAASQAPEAVPRHPLELRALVDPDGVRAQLPPLLDQAAKADDSRQLSLLYLAQANACRVVADWPCQRSAGGHAWRAAKAAGSPVLQVRGLIAQSRGAISMQDFIQGESLLGQAQGLLALHPFPELQADVYLAFSALNYTLGKHLLAADYAARGLLALGDAPALPMRIRLLRNQANAVGQMGRIGEADALVKQGLRLVDQLQDPKLNAELHLEDARLAGLKGDVAAQVADADRILALAAQLGNSQLTGLGHELLGTAAMARAEPAAAAEEYRIAFDSFHALKLQRDERRVLRALLQSMLGRGLPPSQLEPLVGRVIELETALDAGDNLLASNDVDARLKYARQEFDLQRLEASASLASERAAALDRQQQLAKLVAGLSIGLLMVMGAFYLLQRRLTTRLRQTLGKLLESEERYRTSEARMRAITDNIPAVITRVDRDERYVFANAAACRIFGMDMQDMLHRPIREVRGEERYQDAKAHIEAALRGEAVRYEGSAEIAGRLYHYQSNYVPDRDADGAVQGFYALTMDITQLKKAEAELSRLARVDSLTGVANRRDFVERLDIAVARSQRQQEPMCLLCLDLDDFKAINDSHGHAVGDAVILAFAERLQGCVREDDLVARLGGDEFMILLERPGPASGEIVATKLLAAMHEPIRVGDLALQVAASIGVANASRPLAADSLMARADQALYQAKSSGRNTFRVAGD